ncbi:T-cell receptor alpha chain V region PY14 [Sciurus carolinensis]|nr:T-cell receptor alpha chain V region PY14 [Sciurus carolinensis]
MGKASLCLVGQDTGGIFPVQVQVFRAEVLVSRRVVPLGAQRSSALRQPTPHAGGGTRAQTVTQSENHISVFEGVLVQVKCNYSYTGSPVLFWYVQYPGQGLQVLLKHTSRDSAKGFTAALDRGEKSFHLQKPSVQVDDSATYYCALSGTVTALAREAEHKPFRVTEYFLSALSVVPGKNSSSRAWH